jgi:hypothetical protein
MAARTGWRRHLSPENIALRFLQLLSYALGGWVYAVFSHSVQPRQRAARIVLGLLNGAYILQLGILLYLLTPLPPFLSLLLVFLCAAGVSQAGRTLTVQFKNESAHQMTISIVDSDGPSPDFVLQPGRDRGIAVLCRQPLALLVLTPTEGQPITRDIRFRGFRPQLRSVVISPDLSVDLS